MHPTTKSAISVSVPPADRDQGLKNEELARPEKDGSGCLEMLCPEIAGLS
jgi:hypothetical protein